ncbi:MAG TPA: LysR family transcriptional regulator [Candidatus Coprenecus stercoravium]|uniref:LysR family transcriptional regulator n=1 Tax=Candidatus Coprenecus stercoravium TaxID=2840735 RepID=A0A9D2GQG3_9BACT|nr:LysR family transcriptional regulator [Candidatus Coprenecus stercoravium]
MICDFRLKVFYTVAVKGGFTAAAKELGISQPAVSNHIFELENEIGDTLFHRNRRGTPLTSKGRILFDYAEKILNLYSCADRELTPSGRGQLRQLTIAASPDAARFILKPLAEYFARVYPGTDISVLERTAEESDAMIADAEADIAITGVPLPQRDSKVFATVSINGGTAPMLTYYITLVKERMHDNPAINDFILCCKTFLYGKR